MGSSSKQPFRCRWCHERLSSRFGRNGLPRHHCNASHRALAAQRKKFRRPHRRVRDRTWAVVDIVELARTGYVQPNALRIQRDLGRGVAVPGVRRVE